MPRQGPPLPPIRSVVLLIAGTLLLTGCFEERVAPSRGQAAAMAEQFLLSQEWDWGPIERYWEPIPGHPQYGQWWQLDFHGPTPDGRSPVLLVDARNGWVRFPPADYRLRLDLGPQPPEPGSAPVTVQPGSWIHLLQVEHPELPISADLAALNRRAADAGLPPLFALRQPRGGARQLVYGWDGTRGIERDGRVSAWLSGIARWPDPRWIDLAPEIP